MDTALIMGCNGNLNHPSQMVMIEFLFFNDPLPTLPKLCDLLLGHEMWLWAGRSALRIVFSANCLLVVCPKQSIFSLILCLKPHPSPYSTWNMKYIRNTLFVMGVEYTAFLAGDVCMCVTVCLPWFIFFQICALHDIPSKHSISVKTLRKKKKKKGF